MIDDLRQLLEEWAPRAYRFALRLTLDPHTAEDLTQEALLRAWQRRAQLRDPQAIRGWLFQIVANLWRDRLRRDRSPIHQASSLEEEPSVSQPAPLKIMADREEAQQALQAMDALPDRQRETLFLSACEGLSTKEIAEILDITPNAVKVHLSLARKKLREQLMPRSQTTS